MSRQAWNSVLIVALVTVIALALMGPAETSRRNFEYFPDMARSPRYNTFAPNPNFTDGKTLQSPVAGTISIDDPTASPRFQESTMVPRRGRDLENPFSTGDAAALARGRVVFEGFCRPCHGAGGLGDGAVVARGFPAPPPLTTGSALDRSDTEIFQLITRGSTEMPAHGPQIAPSDRWKVVLYVRDLQHRASSGGGTRGGVPR